ncbi:hypothetical protein EJ06DRAFT_219468 [Trichodelitschia bisporula]|uniref:F-box domain-containing protein n=1 Tax=Trichodelitschia bisporula TaxID=703511 RepID=A0A6G1I8Z5_9PEZI|nr:hypothetical protein EJ06DRAFT_219468 [Trichodelitschia bisporula]
MPHHAEPDPDSDPPRLPPLLRLPLELRPKIYAHLLPHTLPCDNNLSTFSLLSTSHSLLPTSHSLLTTWHPGHIGLLSTSQQLSLETLTHLYSHSTFEIDLTFSSTAFRLAINFSSGFSSFLYLPFPSRFSPRVLALMRRFFITLWHPDYYKGMVMYNCDGEGVTAVVRAQVSALIDVLRVCNHDLILVHMWVIYGPGDRCSSTIAPHTQSVLKPFQLLRGLRRARVEGNVTADPVALLREASRRAGVGVRLRRRPAQLQAIGVISPQRAFTFRTPIEGV